MAYRVLMETIGECAAMASEDGTILFANNLCAELLGKPLDSVIGSSLLSYVRGEGLECVCGALKGGYGNGKHGELELVRADGSLVSIHTSVNKFELEGQATLYFIATDLTERNKAEAERSAEFERLVAERTQELEEVNEQLEFQARLLGLIQEAILTTDAEYRITSWNSGAEERYGWSAEEVMGRDALEVLKAEFPAGTDRETVFEVLREEGQLRVEFRHTRKDGRPIYVDALMFTITEVDGGLTGYAGINRDNTQRKMDEEALLAANQELAAYAHTVSHDLRNPLATMVLANEVLRDALEDDDPEALREAVEESVRVMGLNIGMAFSLTKDLLTLAEAGAIPDLVEEVSVTEVVGRILEEHASSIRRRKIEIRKDADYGRIIANDTQIYQLFSNLISNAITHNDNPQPVVSILSMGESDGARLFKVCDNSSGFSEEMLAKAFDPFQKTGKGTGIGLTIAKKIALLYGGTIRAYNDNGACIEVTLRDFEKVTE